MINALTFITGNSNKVAELQRYLSIPLDHHKYDLPEIQSLDLEEIVKTKAESAFAQAGKPVLVEDVSLTFPSLGKLPGPLVKWFLQEVGNEGLCRLLDGKADRTAVAEVCYGLHDGEQVRFFHGSCHGTVAEHPRGPENFGWNVVFVPEGSEKTWAEMGDDERDETSMRKGAMEEIERFLSSPK